MVRGVLASCGDGGVDCVLGCGGGSCNAGIYGRVGGIIAGIPGGLCNVVGVSDCDELVCSLCSGRPRDTPERGIQGGQEGCRVKCGVWEGCVGLRTEVTLVKG